MASIFDVVTGKIPAGDTNKQGKQGGELKRLRRQDLLELLVGQMKEADALRADIEKRDKTIDELNHLTDRLKDKLDLKDIQIDHLKERLDGKDVQIGRLTKKLDDKDTQINHLKERLDGKDVRIEQLEMRVKNIADAKGMITLEELLIMEKYAMERFARSHVPEDEEAQGSGSVSDEGAADEDVDALEEPQDQPEEVEGDE